MRKHQNDFGLGRGVAAISLSCALAAFGCTTNRTPGNGQPSSVMPMTSPASPSSTPGTSSGTNPPMASAMLEPSAALPLIVPRGDGAAGITGARPRVQMRYLGPAFPAATGPELSAQQVTGQVVPAMVNPQMTVNSSISSGPTEVVTSGGGDGSGNIVISGGTFATSGTPTVTSAASVTPNVGTSSSIASSAITSGTSVAAPVFNSSTAIVTPTAAASALTAGQFAAGPGATTGAATATGTTLVTPGAIINNNNSGTLTPTLSSGATPTPTAAASLGVRTISGATVTTTNGLTATNTSTSSSVRSASATGRLASPVNRSTNVSSGNVHVTTGASGNVVITNQ